MIPNRLRLMNFMSYAELDLDFRGLHSAVLSGRNGAGKSSLLDAMTYALWDKARGPGEQLIRLGQTEMWVELEFELEGEQYRVWRRRTKKAGGSGQLEFQLLAPGQDPETEGAWLALTGGNVRETQARILETLRMDYETFVNSAFILQGRADAFTTKTPRERKAVLGEILGLGRYDALTTKAREKWKQAQAEAEALEAEQEELRERLTRREAVEAETAEASAAIAALGDRTRAAEARWAEAMAGLHALGQAETRRLELAAAREKASVARDRVTAEAEAQAAAIAEAEARLGERQALAGAHAEWQRLSEQEAAMRRAEEAHARLERQRAEAGQALQAAEHAHARRRRTLEGDLEAIVTERAPLLEALAERERVERAYAELKSTRLAEEAHLERAHADRGLEARWHALDREAETFRLRAVARRQERQARLTRAREEAEGLAVAREALALTEAAIAELAIAAVEQERAKEKGIQFRARRDALAAEAERARATSAAKERRVAELERSLALRAVAPAPRGEPPEAPCPLCETALPPMALAGVLARLRAEAAGYEAEAERLEDDMTRLDAERQGARARFAELAERLKPRDSLLIRLGALGERISRMETAQDEAEAIARELAEPLESALPEELARAIATVEAERSALAYDPAELAVLQARSHDLRWAEPRHFQLEQAAKTLQKLEARLPEAESALAAQDAQTESERRALEGRLASLEQELAALGYDAAAHQALRRALEPLEDVPGRWAALERQALWLDSAKDLLARLERERREHAEQASLFAGRLSALEHELALAPERQREAAAAEAALTALRAEERRRLEARGRLEAEQAQLQALAARLAERSASRERAVLDASAFKALALAFGKDGIQAILIENALPELEEEANRLLARMTENRMHVRLATQREKKSGGVHETLEIHIADELGIRPYELYSGGEAFRVDFAVRLALSKLLTHRAGARLQTLVIDEGFGTQDAQGRERLIEAIGAVSSDFARILVITHIRELKEAFNAQIEVEKRGGVSEVRLIS